MSHDTMTTTNGQAAVQRWQKRHARQRRNRTIGRAIGWIIFWGSSSVAGIAAGWGVLRACGIW